MGSSPIDADSDAAPIFFSSPEKPYMTKKIKPSLKRAASSSAAAAEREASPTPPEAAWPRRSRSGNVMLEGYLEATTGPDAGDQGSDGGESVGRTKSLTDDDLEELKGCLDLGFGFSYDEIPELCGTLPALELCYSMSQRFLDEQQLGRPPVDVDGDESSPAAAPAAAPPSLPIANWRISGPGDHPDDVKARLKYWAQAVACTVKLCN